MAQNCTADSRRARSLLEWKNGRFRVQPAERKPCREWHEWNYWLNRQDCRVPEMGLVTVLCPLTTTGPGETVVQIAGETRLVRLVHKGTPVLEYATVVHPCLPGVASEPVTKTLPAPSTAKVLPRSSPPL